VTAATAADVRAGVAVVDTQGGAVGTIESVDAEGAVVATGNVRAKLPISSFGRNAQGLVISLTRAELEAAASAQTPS
jgi:preprotein translocase subunit YajC